MIKETYRPAVVDDLDQFETRHGITLPVSYRRFLLEQNGGIPSPSLFRCQNGGMVNVGIIFPITGSQIDDSLIAFPRAVQGGLLPVANSGGGDHFFVELASGSVFYWDHHANTSDFQPAEAQFLATDIQSLVSALEGPVTVADPLEAIVEAGDVERLNAFVAQHSIQKKSPGGRTPLMECARHGDLELVKWCIAAGARTDDAKCEMK